jgi:hypothetical protein
LSPKAFGGDLARRHERSIREVKSMFQQIRTIVAASIVAVAAVGCASQGRAPATQHNVISAAELTRAGDVNLYEALSQLRPAFLRSRNNLPGVTTPAAPVQVYIQGMRMGEIEHLRQIVAKSVAEVRFLEPQQAISRFGGNNTGGAILVVMK